MKMSKIKSIFWEFQQKHHNKWIYVSTYSSLSSSSSLLYFRFFESERKKKKIWMGSNKQMSWLIFWNSFGHFIVFYLILNVGNKLRILLRISLVFILVLSNKNLLLWNEQVRRRLTEMKNHFVNFNDNHLSFFLNIQINFFFSSLICCVCAP